MGCREIVFCLVGHFWATRYSELVIACEIVVENAMCNEITSAKNWAKLLQNCSDYSPDNTNKTEVENILQLISSFKIRTAVFSVQYNNHRKR